ncbi:MULTISPECIES: fimbrial protein [Enterobacter]|uniref:fimbrial protein n=1 Tax=Enterobacter TaxID=547 RepID=UPI000B9FADE1|nr:MULTISPECIES: fimbrial protein [Enterobacter]MBE3476515.1 fimbrial protein [Enterobacter cloacae complex sp. P13B]MBE3540178.1 fimbrial protein [Enterobacter cloacae complex sp. I7]MCK6696298.1 fimbrial protein [Enterobacter bugandensis]OZU95321.1 fimbrial protein [Enterobacter roggenkampii]WFC92789.1 fimbrial protein [Enterobacter roggenkampii]
MNFKLMTIAAMVSFSSMAADTVNINVTGTIVASPCVINGGSANLNVDLGSAIQASALSSAGSTSSPVSFTIPITACPVGTSSVLVSFSGTPDPVAGTSYYVSTGTATNVAVGLYQASNGNLLGNGSSVTQTVQSDRTASLALQAKAYSAAGSVMPGTINSVIVATMQYN